MSWGWGSMFTEEEWERISKVKKDLTEEEKEESLITRIWRICNVG